MPSYKHFEELPVWKEGAKLYNLVLDLLDEHAGLFSAGFRNQIDRAALSVPNNIAEVLTASRRVSWRCFSVMRAARPAR